MNISDKKFLVLGLGVSGLSSLKLLKALNNQVTCVNSGEIKTWKELESIKKYSDENYSWDDYFSNEKLFIDLVDLEGVILSPGISKNHHCFEIFKKHNIPIIGEIELAYQAIKNQDIPIIAVTGTNGKTTIVSLINSILESSDYKTFLGGNIGTPFADYARKFIKDGLIVDVIILELSSFQLESIVEFSPSAACIINLSAHHGERYSKFEDYIHAKENIFSNMNVHAPKIINSNIKSLLANPNLNYRLIHEENLLNLKEYNLEKFSLVGNHNLVNLSFAMELIKSLGLSLKGIQYTIDTFKGVEHRLQSLDNLRGDIVVFNDAKSTNWDATMTAIKSLKGKYDKKEKRLILGGKLRGENDSILPYIEKIKEENFQLYLFGEAASSLSLELVSTNYKGHKVFENLEDIIIYDKDNYNEGVVLFSPGFPSFDQFSSYVKRGEKLVELAQKYYGRESQ